MKTVSVILALTNKSLFCRKHIYQNIWLTVCKAEFRKDARLNTDQTYSDEHCAGYCAGNMGNIL